MSKVINQRYKGLRGEKYYYSYDQDIIVKEDLVIDLDKRIVIKGGLIVGGSLEVHNGMQVLKDIKVDGVLDSSGNHTIQSHRSVQVGSDIKGRPSIIAAENIDVKGSVSCFEVITGKQKPDGQFVIGTGGDIEIAGDLVAIYLDTGGNLEVGGYIEVNSTDITQFFEPYIPIGVLKAEGHIKSGDYIYVANKIYSEKSIKSMGDLTCGLLCEMGSYRRIVAKEDVFVSGKIISDGDIYIGGMLSANSIAVKGEVKVEKEVDIDEKIEIKGKLDCKKLLKGNIVEGELIERDNLKNSKKEELYRKKKIKMSRGNNYMLQLGRVLLISLFLGAVLSLFFTYSDAPAGYWYFVTVFLGIMVFVILKISK
jgi:predicted acyltransferase (DUF342 family)